MSIILQVWLQPTAEVAARAGQFQVVEVDATDFPDFCDMVTDDVLISGQQLHTRRTDSGRYEIMRRHPIAFRGSAVTRCQPNTVDCVEPA